jgi:nitrate/TMAO reductase-like tetraheme cytochrome c subunit
MHMRRRLSKAVKARVKARDGNKCVICGDTARLEVHHRDDDPTNDSMDNLETRCPAHNPRGASFQYVDDPTRHRP